MKNKALCLAMVLVGAVTACAQDALVVKSYPVQPTILDVCGLETDLPSTTDSCASPTNDVSTEKISAELQKFLARMGVPFPEGSWVRYGAAANALTMRNTEFNHEILGSLLLLPDMTPYQVELVVTTYRLHGEFTLPLRIGQQLTTQLLTTVPSNSLKRVTCISLLGKPGRASESATAQCSLTATSSIGPDSWTIYVKFAYLCGREPAPQNRIASEVELHNGVTVVLQHTRTTNAQEFVTLTANLVTADGKLVKAERRSSPEDGF